MPEPRREPPREPAREPPCAPPTTIIGLLESLTADEFAELARETLAEERAARSDCATVAAVAAGGPSPLQRLRARCDFELFESRGRVDFIRVSAADDSLFDIIAADSDAWDELPAGRKIRARDGSGHAFSVRWRHGGPGEPALLCFGSYAFLGEESLPTLEWLTAELRLMEKERRRPLWRGISPVGGAQDGVA